MNAFGYESNSEYAVASHTEHSRRASTCHKMLVSVRAEHRIDGTVRPLSFFAPNGRKVVIDRLVSVRRAASLKAGGVGIRYEVRVTCGETCQVVYLFDDDGVWFVEKD